MKLTILTVGRVKRGPERELIDDYLSRAAKLGGSLGFRSVDEVEVESGGGMEREGERLLSRIPSGARIIRLDERGKTMRSEALASMLANIRDNGEDLCFLIGGADGYSADVIAAAPQTLSLGAFTWPHRLVRVMIAEQVYRGFSILAGTPYHKD